MHYSAPYSIPYGGGNGYGSGSNGGNSSGLRRPSYVSQFSSDGYSSAGGSNYSSSYGSKYRGGGSDFIPGNPNPYIGNQSRAGPPSSDYYRPNSVAGVAADYNKNNYNSGYNSDYGRSGYASGNNSDYGQSDYNRRYTNNYNYDPLLFGNRRSRDMSKSSTYTPSTGRYSNYGRYSSSSGVRSDYNKGKISSGRTNYSLQSSPYVASGRVADRRESYTRSASREVSPVKTVSANVNSTVNRTTSDGLARKPKDCKAPADFTSESSSSSSDEDDDDSPNEDNLTHKYVVCRSTSPTQKPPRATEEQVQSISSLVKMKQKSNSNKPKMEESGTQTTYEDFQQVNNTEKTTNKGRTARFIPSTTKLSSSYYDRYYNKYTSPSTTSRTTSRSTGTNNSSCGRLSCSPTKSEISNLNSRSVNVSGSKLNLRQVSRSNSHEDYKSSPNSPLSPSQDNKMDFKVTKSSSGKIGSSSNSEVANKEYRKSVLNMNVNEIEMDGEKHCQLSKSQSRVRNISKSSSQTKQQPQIAEQSSSTSTSSTSSDEQQQQVINNRRPPSRTRTAEMEKLPTSNSKSNLDVRNRRGSSKSSQEDLLEKRNQKGSKENGSRSRKSSHDSLEDKRRSSREDLRRRPHSRQASNEDDDSSEDGHEKHNSGRLSALHRRRRNSKDDAKSSVLHSPKRQSSTEGMIEDLPPRPSRQGSRESMLDTKTLSSSKVNSQNSSRENLLSDEKSAKTPRRSNNKSTTNLSSNANLGPGRWIVPTDVQPTLVAKSPQRSPNTVEIGDSSDEALSKNVGRSSPDGIDNQETYLAPPNNTHRLQSPNISKSSSDCAKKLNDKKFISHFKDIDKLLDGGGQKKTSRGTFDDFEEKYQEDNSNLIIVTPPPPNNMEQNIKRDEAKKTLGHFIGKCQDIDDVLGKVEVRPNHLLLKKNIDEERTENEEDEEDSDESDTCSSAGEEVAAHVVKVHDSKAQQPHLETYTEEIDSSAVRIRESKAVVPELEVYTEEIDASGVRIKNVKAMKGNITTPKRLQHSCTVKNIPKSNQNQYFDSNCKQQKENLLDNRKNKMFTTNAQSSQVTSIIEKLSNLEDKNLQHTLFSLKQLFQDDQNLVSFFVKSNGLSHLIRLGFETDNTYQNHILRALGQIMLYVDGMNGVVNYPETIQFLYSLISSKVRAIAKTALKLLTVFVDYAESNCLLLINSINSVDSNRGMKPWTNVMMLLNEKDSVDMDSLTIAASLINKTLRGICDQDTYYNVVDCLEVQGMERVIQRYMSKQGSDLELLQQFQIYESVLRQEDGDEDRNQSQTSRVYRRKDNRVQRKSFRHSQNHIPITPPTRQMVIQNPIKFHGFTNVRQRDNKLPVSKKSSSDTKLNDLNGVTPALRRRRENRTINKDSNVLQEDSAQFDRQKVQIDEENKKNKEISRIPCRVNDNNQKLNVPRKLSGSYYNKNQEEEIATDERRGDTSPRLISQAEVFDLRRENTVKDIQKKLRSQESLPSPTADTNHLADFSGLVNKAKEGLNKSSSRTEMKTASVGGNLTGNDAPNKKAENDLHWDHLRENLNKPLLIKDMDFTDLGSDDDDDVLQSHAGWSKGIPPCPPPLPCPVMMGSRQPPPPPPPLASIKFAPPPPPLLINNPGPPPPTPPSNHKLIKKNKKTVKLFWKEVSEDYLPAPNNNKPVSIWDELKPVNVDTQKLEHLFENRAKDLMNKKQQEMNKNKEIIVLDPKRSNAINIGMTKLPPPRTIKTAILKMDSSIMNREGIEKILTTMMPTEEEKAKIVEAQMNNPDVPLGSAEQFLLTLASITELTARLRLWAFKLDYDVIEREVAEPLMDLKQGIEDLKKNNTFRCILATLLSVGNFLNGVEAKGFQIDYLAKVPEVKDTVHKHSLLHHLFHMVLEKFPDTTDLYSEIGAITRAAKVDFDEVVFNLIKLETECKASWDYLKAIAKHDGTASVMKSKMSEFLAECAEQIIVLGIIHRRILNRFFRFLLYLGIPPRAAKEMKINYFLKTVSEFALEYRTTRERVLQQLEKKICHRERNKTKGKFFTELAKSKEVQADDELRQLLGAMSDSDDYKWGTVPGVRGRLRKADVRPPVFNQISSSSRDESMTDGDDEILESLVKNYRNNPRERRRIRQGLKK